MRFDGRRSGSKVVPSETYADIAAKIGIGKVVLFFMTNESITCKCFVALDKQNRESLRLGSFRPL